MCVKDTQFVKERNIVWFVKGSLFRAYKTVCKSLKELTRLENIFGCPFRLNLWSD